MLETGFGLFLPVEKDTSSSLFLKTDYSRLTALVLNRLQVRS